MNSFFKASNITGSRQIDSESFGLSLYRTGVFTPSTVGASGSNYFLITIQTTSPLLAWRSEMYATLLSYSQVSTNPSTYSFLFFVGNFLQTLTGNADLAVAPVYWYNFIPNTHINKRSGEAALFIKTGYPENVTLFHSGYWPLRVNKTHLYTAANWNTSPAPPIINNQNGVTYGTSEDLPTTGKTYAMFTITKAKRLYSLSAEYQTICWRIKANKLQSVGSIVYQRAFNADYAPRPQWGVTTIDVTGYYPFSPPVQLGSGGKQVDYKTSEIKSPDEAGFIEEPPPLEPASAVQRPPELT